MRVLVCGGRNFNDVGLLHDTLNELVEDREPITSLIHGASRGADMLADDWAGQHDIDVISVPADWRKYGRAAGPLRNAKMLLEHDPDLVVAFPGGKGTRNMVQLAKDAGIEVIEVDE